MKIATSSTLPPPSPPPVFSSVPLSPTRTTLLVSLPPCSCTLPCHSSHLAGTLLSQITPDILLHPFHPACTLFFTSLPHSPLLCTVEPRYLKSSTFATSSPGISLCRYRYPASHSHTCMYSVFLLLTFIPLLSTSGLLRGTYCSTSFPTVSSLFHHFLPPQPRSLCPSVACECSIMTEP